MSPVGRSQNRSGTFGGGTLRSTDRAPIPSQDMLTLCTIKELEGRLGESVVPVLDAC